MSDGKLEVRTYRSLDELESIAASWDDLLANYPRATTFSTPQWLTSWWQSFGKSQELLVVAFFADSHMVALAPFSITDMHAAKTIPLRQLRLMGDGSHDSDNLDLPVRPGFEDQFATSLLEFLEAERKSWDFCELNTMPPQSPGAQALQRLLERKQWVAIEKQRPASAIPLPANWEEYLAHLSSEDQKNLARYARRLEKRYAVQIYRCGAENQLPKCLEALFEHHQARWEAAGESGSFGSPERRNFYHELGRSLLAQGRLDLWVLEIDGAVAAAQFGFRYGNQVFQLQEGNDPAHTSDRVGFVLRGHVLRQLIADGIRTYDFLGGDLGYKARWGAQSRLYTDIHFARPRTLGGTYLQARHKTEQSKAWLRRNLPRQAWDILHRINLQLRGNSKNLSSLAGSRIEIRSANKSSANIQSEEKNKNQPPAENRLR
jgi:CelD/BcsL family acetyltransferase involved in cellulose biosynthesis